MPKILVIGSLNMDIVINTSKIPAIGETVIGGGFITTPGGKGANQAVAAAKLGGKVSMVGCVGDDIFGKDLVNNLSASSVNIEKIKCLKNVPTGIAMIVVKDGNNCIIVDPGANYQISCEMVNQMEEEIKDSSIVVLQLGIPIETVERVIEIAKKNRVKVLLNPAPATWLNDELLSKVDVFIPNESECEFITGLQLKTIEDAKKAALFLLSKGIPQVIITLGSKGVIYNKGTNIIHKTVPPVEVIDTTAAGDSFTGAIAVALSDGKTIDEAIDFANIVGTLTVTKKGAQASLPTLYEVDKYIVDMVLV